MALNRIDKNMIDQDFVKKVDDTKNELDVFKNDTNEQIVKKAEQSDLASALNQISDLKNSKTSKTYVDTNLAKKATKEELLITDGTANEALAKANNPLNAISTAGYKLQLSDLSDEVKSAMTGGTLITDARGQLNNSTVDFPLKKVVRNGVFENIDSELQNAILDMKVINAKKDKYYRISWIGNGTTAFEQPSPWGISVFEHDKETFASDSGHSAVEHVNRLDYNISKPTGITTRILESKVDDVIFVVTIDYSKLINRVAYDLNNNTASKVGYSAVVDESCYLFSTAVIEKRSLVCRKKGNNLSVKFKYIDTDDMVLDFDLLGINGITHLKSVGRQPNNKNYPTPFWGNIQEWYKVSTDWISPYGIMAKNNVVDPNATFTVGGNHGTNGAGGFATARQVSAEMYANNTLVNDGDVVYADSIVIKVINLISASNAIVLSTGEKRDSVKEFVTYTITNNNIEVSTTLEAIEDVEITRYTGLQASKGAYDELYFMSDSKAKQYDISTTPTSPIYSDNKSNSDVDRILLRTEDDLLVVYMDRNIGLGNLSHLADNNAVAFYSTSNKAYLHCIVGTGLPLTLGEFTYYRGGYTFMRSLSSGAESAYILKQNNRKIYVVDFMRLTPNTILKPLAEDYGKTITVIEKSETVTVDNFISSNGLKLSSTGYGQLKFTVDEQ